ncbi:MAG: diguanylate cyclase (GGDEF)-like protein [Gammaproteobacteria bacterium]|jgi:diguanylate cyclase (GGDEF)-like protein
MESPRIPENEKIRLASLYSMDLLDTPAEERFDRYTRIAQKLYQVPVALISLVDSNRQWFKSCIGLPVLETSREISFCGHAILQNDIYIVNDTHQDEIFVDNPLVTNDPKIRFYAGVPLVTVGGLTLGTLCIIDNKPRNLNRKDLSELIDLAQILMTEVSALELSVSDPLTDLVNRRGFMVLAENNLLLANRGGYSTILIYLDLDGLKIINDTFGHDIGDRLLRDFSVLMQGVVRKSDVVARIGGDEFVMLLNNTNTQKAENIIAELVDLVAGYNAETENNHSMSFSFGFSEYDSSQPSSLELLLQAADQMMYSHKAAKKQPTHNLIKLKALHEL